MLTRPRLSSSHVQIRPTTTADAITGVKNAVRKIAMPGTDFCTSNATSSGRSTSGGTTPARYRKLLRAAIQNFGSSAILAKFSTPVN